MSDNLSATLRLIRDRLAPLRERSGAAAAALEVLERDLLPRSAGGDAYLVVGIVGPNNAGKSALFNALVGSDLSPSLPTGGATRRLVGAAHPSLLEKLRSEPTLTRFPLVALDGPRADQATESSANPAELLVAAETGLPAGLMLIDTPDFDSILEDNRLASESLLAVADLVIAVVTRHSYQNRAVVDFLQDWLAHGRPWLLVYNEAADRPTAESHAAKLATDVGTPPLARFWAPHDLEVQAGRKTLEPQPLGEAKRQPVSLQRMLFDLEEIAEVKSRAFEAARARLRDSLRELADQLDADANAAGAIATAVGEAAREGGVQIASAAMPAGPFVEAFRIVLDRRTNFLSRGWRTSLRQIRLGLESIPALLRGRAPAEEKNVQLDAIETEALRSVWPGFWEELVRDFGTEARHRARPLVAAGISAQLDADLDDSRTAEARARAEEVLRQRPAELSEFRSACEDLVEKAIEERGFDIDIQAAADIATLMPIALAAVVIVQTAGLGSDVAAAGGGALSTFLIEKYYHLLGRGVMNEARRRWTELRGAQLADLLIEATLPNAAPALRHAAESDATLAGELRQLARGL